MNSEKLSDAIGEVGGRYYEEAATYRRRKHGWVKWAGLAACLALAAAAVLPSAAKQPTTTPDTPSVVMSGVHINEMQQSSVDGTKLVYDPSYYDNAAWDSVDIVKYYGSDLTPAYIPEGLVPAESNGTATVYIKKDGTVADDLVSLGFYHDYYADGSPKLTDSIAAVKGFSLEASRLGKLDGCCMAMPVGEAAEPTDIGGVSVTFGHCLVDYGPYDPDTHEPAGQYERYTAEFTLNGISYRITTDQLAQDEIVKIVSSIIFGEVAEIK